jgi:hypothetical protein
MSRAPRPERVDSRPSRAPATRQSAYGICRTHLADSRREIPEASVVIDPLSADRRGGRVQFVRSMRRVIKRHLSVCPSTGPRLRALHAGSVSCAVHHRRTKARSARPGAVVAMFGRASARRSGRQAGTGGHMRTDRSARPAQPCRNRSPPGCGGIRMGPHSNRGGRPGRSGSRGVVSWHASFLNRRLIEAPSPVVVPLKTGECR